jgi:chain length determinant protein tyrosine kinase EpsG
MNRNPPPQLLQAASLALSEAPNADAALMLGQILVQGGRLAPEDVDRVVEFQREKSLRFGQAGQMLGLLTPDDLRYGLSVQFDYPYLGPDSALDARLLAAHQPESAQAEQWRALRSELALRWLSVPNPSRALAVVSPDRREGRSLAAANLAIAFSQLGQRTLLIDADLRRPSLNKALLDPKQTPAGLTDYFSGNAPLESIIHQTGVENLSLITAGQRAPNPAELLAATDLPALFNELLLTYDRIIIDSAPVNAVSDALVIAPHVHKTILVVRAGKTPRKAILRCIMLLKKAQATLGGFVLNRLPTGRTAGYYYYYYYGDKYEKDSAYGSSA